MSDLISVGLAARAAARQLAGWPSQRKDEALLAIAGELEAQTAAILGQNSQDVNDGRIQGLSNAAIGRITLNADRVAALAADARRLAGLPDPVGAELEGRLLPNGLRLSRRRIPIGVIGAIYEERPETILDVACLCLKTGNAAILRGSGESQRTNLALMNSVLAALETVGFPPAAVQYLDGAEPALLTQLLRLDEYIDLIIARGGAELQRQCQEQSRMPVIGAGRAICHLYVDETADLERAGAIVENAKVQRPDAANALNTLLVHQGVAHHFLSTLAARLAEWGVEFRADPEALDIVEQAYRWTDAAPAGPDDFDQEWRSLVLGVKLVASLEEAIEHIRRHSTGHSDGILTNSLERANHFVAEVNSAVVYVNASTRFTDGQEFGLGAEAAVSNAKLHARGPLGPEALTTYKWVAVGDGHLRA
ncbi:MAG: glutamate-5-semialdehyde dehydrogenase [Candidatus Promineifilaceae bacterium]